MLKSEFGEVHMVKCIVCPFVKGKDVIMGLKFDTLEKHARKAKAIHDMANLGNKKGKFYIYKNVIILEMRSFFAQHQMLIVKQIQGVVKGEQGEKMVAICHNPTASVRRLTFVAI